MLKESSEMASPSEDQRNRQETSRIKEMMHKTKTIQFFGRTTPIILQNENGPCPLLAICNILLLRNNLSLSSDASEVSQEKLLSLVAERLIDSNSNIDNKDAGYVENQQQNIADAIDLLPRLATGIDVNLKFMRINDFEFTRECAIFDLLDIPLYHGWIVDPQDSDTSNAIGSKSYNTLMGELVALETQNMESIVRKSDEDVADFGALPLSAEVPSQSLSPHAITDEQIERGEVAEEREPLRAFELSKNACSISANGVNVDDTAGTEVNNLCQQEPSTSDNITLMNTHNDDLITFETVPEQDACSSLEADNESLNGQMNTSVSNKHESNDGNEKTSIIEVLPKAEDTSLSKSGSDSLPPVDEFEKINIGEEKSYEAHSFEPVVLLESSEGISQTIDESKSLITPAVGNEPVCLLKTSTTTNEVVADATRPNDGTTSRQGELITNFLKSSASQLTIYGLFSLQDGLKERELCVFFRNNHFNTMFKFEGELYILATDQGYLNQPDLVWEKLNEVNGDTVFMTSNFKKFKAESHDTSLWDEQNVMTDTADYLARIDNTSQGSTSFNSDLQLAMALQQQEFDQQQQPPRVLPQSPTTSSSGLVVGPRHVQPSRPRNSSASSSRQEPKPSKEKCTVM